ncbi:MAG: thioredoxin-like domain-containing protein [Bacteroidia bacterium]|nr:thioredoxin-like domain-containing protein [Bacteroidia bacterium]
MKNVLRLWGFTILCLASAQVFSQGGYKIEVTVSGFSGKEAYLAYYYGDKQYIKDTAAVQNGSFVFAGEEMLDGGIYLIVFPPKNNYFEVILDKDQKFKLVTDTLDYVQNMKVTGSDENDYFYRDIQFLGGKRIRANEINEKLKNAGLPAEEDKKLRDELSAIDGEVKAFRKKFMDEHPELFYVKVLASMQEPVIPESPKDENGKALDSLFAYKYYRAHYFDHIDFTDDRMLRTPIFHNKIEQYMERLIPKHPDSINAALDRLIDRSRGNDDVFQYLVVNQLNKYAGSKIMGMDAVYVHLVEKYYMSGEAWWTDEETLKKMEERALALSPNLVGRPAPNFRVQDAAGNYRDLYGVEAEYTLLYFWDYDCGHCKKITPKLAEAYKRYKDHDVALFAVSINGDVEVWKKKIQEYGLSNAINVQDHYRQSGFDKMYDIRSTPRLFILDENKKIIAKQIAVSQMEEILSRELGLPVPEKTEEDEMSDEE